MRERDFVDQFAELAARVKRIERWQDQWGTRNRKMASLLADGVQSSGGYLVTATQGLAANFHKELTPASITYASGWHLLADFSLANGYHSIIPTSWELPAKQNDVVCEVAFQMSDASWVSNANHETSAVRGGVSDLDFDKDGLTVVLVRFAAWNHSDAEQTLALGTFKFEGWQV